MGIDACIYVTARDGCYVPRLEQPLPRGFLIVPAREWAPAAATHEVDNGFRYYGPGYARGPWPDLCAALMLLMNSPDISTVWYHGDSGGAESDAPFTPQQLAEFTAYFIQRGRRDYMGPWLD